MRVLSFIPAILLAAAGFVAAAPTAPACVPAGTGNDAALQPVISAITDATAKIQVLNDQLTAAKSDAKQVDAIVVKITAVVEAVVVEVQAAAKIELSDLDLTNLGVAIDTNIALILGVLNVLASVVLNLGTGISASLKTDTTALLNAVAALAGSLHIFVAASLGFMLGPIIVLVTAAVNMMSTMVAKLDVVAVIGA